MRIKFLFLLLFVFFLSGCGSTQTAMVDQNNPIITLEQKAAYEQAGYVCEPIIELSQADCVDTKVGQVCGQRKVEEKGYKCEKVTDDNVNVSADLP